MSLEPTQSTFLKLHYTNPLIVGPGSAAAIWALLRVHRRFVRRVPTVEHLLPRDLAGKVRFRGTVTSVGDADNFRLYHQPTLWPRRVPTNKAGLKDQTWHVRLAGVDAPELSHFGKPAQPYSAEALDWLTKTVLGKKVVVEPFSKDRYGRVVAMAYVRRFPWPWRKNVSAEMLRAGLATVYTSGGAEYGGLLAEFEQLERAARARKKGMWAQSDTAYESPAAYKKRLR